MNINEIAEEVWRKSKQGPASQWIRIEGHKIKVTCIRQVCSCGCHVRFIFWTSQAPWSLIRRVRRVFIPHGIMYPGENGELIRYVQEVYVDQSRNTTEAERESNAIADSIGPRLSSIRGRLVSGVQLSDTATSDGHRGVELQ